MKKICLINFGKVVNSTGGAEKVLCDFANEFSERGYDITIICSENKIGKTYFNLDSRVKFVNLGINVDFNLFKRAVRKICRIFKFSYGFTLNDYDVDCALKNIAETESYDIIINFFPKDLMYVLKNFSAIPKIQMLHGSADWLMKDIDITTVKNLNKVDVLQVLLPSYSKQLSFKNVCVIPNVVKQEGKRAKYSKKVVYLARYDIDKQIHLLVEAFSKCVSEFIDWELHIYGSDWTPGYRESLEHKVRLLNLEKNCFLHGRVSNPNEVLLDASICGFPSKYEGFPLALTEAMSVGLPCIGYKSCTGINEIIIDRKNGFLVDGGIDDFADKMRLLMKDKELCMSMGENAIELIKSFSPQFVYDEWEDLIKRILVRENE